MFDPDKREHLYTQKLFPTVNNEDLLEFRIPPNPKGQLDLANVLLHFMITMPRAKDKSECAWPDNFCAAKQFSSLEVRINGQAVSRRSCANEYYLRAYFQHLVNYSLDYAQSAFKSAGIYDFSNPTTAVIEGYEAATRNFLKNSRQSVDGQHRRYEMVTTIDSTIFYSNDLLPSNSSIDLSFERTKANQSVILNNSSKTIDETGPLILDDCYLLLPFKKDGEMFHLERNAIQRPIKINYDDYQIKRFNIPRGSANIMMTDIMTGPLPQKLFWGVLKMDAYTGSYNTSSTKFNYQHMNKVGMFINGKIADGFPWKFGSDHVAIPCTKFLENTRQYQNALLSRVVDALEFKDGNFILSATIPPDTSGSISFEFQFANALTEDMALIVCSIYDKTMRIDHRRNFQIV